MMWLRPSMMKMEMGNNQTTSRLITWCRPPQISQYFSIISLITNQQQIWCSSLRSATCSRRSTATWCKLLWGATHSSQWWAILSSLRLAILSSLRWPLTHSNNLISTLGCNKCMNQLQYKRRPSLMIQHLGKTTKVIWSKKTQKKFSGIIACVEIDAFLSSSS